MIPKLKIKWYFINMSTLEKSIIEEMEKYIECKEQETNLNKTSQKQEFRNTYFNVKKIKRI